MTTHYVYVHNPFNDLSLPFKVPDTSHPLWWDPESGAPTKTLMFATEAEATSFCARRQIDLYGTGLRFRCAPADQLDETPEDPAARAARQREAKRRVEKVMQKRPRRGR